MPARVPVSPPLPPPKAGLEITTTDHGAEQKRTNGKQKRDSARQEGREPDFQPRRSELRGARAPHRCIPHGAAHILHPTPRAPEAPHADELERGSSSGRRGETASRGRECAGPRRGAHTSTRAQGWTQRPSGAGGWAPTTVRGGASPTCGLYPRRGKAGEGRIRTPSQPTRTPEKGA